MNSSTGSTGNAANTPTGTSTPTMQMITAAPLPPPGTVGAPSFNGENVTSFLNVLKLEFDQRPQLSGQNHRDYLLLCCGIAKVKTIAEQLYASTTTYDQLCAELRTEFKDHDDHRMGTKLHHLEKLKSGPVQNEIASIKNYTRTFLLYLGRYQEAHASQPADQPFLAGWFLNPLPDQVVEGIARDNAVTMTELKAKGVTELAGWVIKYCKEREWLARRTSDKLIVPPAGTVNPYITDPRLGGGAMEETTTTKNKSSDHAKSTTAVPKSERTGQKAAKQEAPVQVADQMNDITDRLQRLEIRSRLGGIPDLQGPTAPQATAYGMDYQGYVPREGRGGGGRYGRGRGGYNQQPPLQSPDQRQMSVPTVEANVSAAAFGTQGSYGYGGNAGNGAHIGDGRPFCCWYCGLEGHIIRDCPWEKRDEKAGICNRRGFEIRPGYVGEADSALPPQYREGGRRNPGGIRQALISWIARTQPGTIADRLETVTTPAPGSDPWAKPSGIEEVEREDRNQRMSGRVSQFAFSPDPLENYEVSINYAGFRGAKDLDWKEKNGEMTCAGLELEEENDALMVVAATAPGRGKERTDPMKTTSQVRSGGILKPVARRSSRLGENAVRENAFMDVEGTGLDDVISQTQEASGPAIDVMEPAESPDTPPKNTLDPKKDDIQDALSRLLSAKASMLTFGDVVQHSPSIRQALVDQLEEGQGGPAVEIENEVLHRGRGPIVGCFSFLGPIGPFICLSSKKDDGIEEQVPTPSDSTSSLSDSTFSPLILTPPPSHEDEDEIQGSPTVTEGPTVVETPNAVEENERILGTRNPRM